MTHLYRFLNRKSRGVHAAWFGLFVGALAVLLPSGAVHASDLYPIPFEPGRMERPYNPPSTVETGDSPLLEDIQAEARQDPRKPLALVWRGPGVCQPACGISAAQAVRGAGFRTLSVFPGFNNEAAFAEAKLWVQPGGKSVTAAAAMGPEFMARVRRFVADGGGYVGFCAGMFIATDLIGTSSKVGFGIVPGKTELHLKDDPPSSMLRITLPNGKWMRMLYVGGPMIHINEQELAALGGHVTARYSDGRAAGVFVPFGKGKVSVIGTHPEAAWWWKLWSLSLDFRSERWFVREMIRSVMPG